MIFSCYKTSFKYEKESPFLDLYRCGDGSYYCIVEGDKIHGTPSIYTETAVVPTVYTRDPSTTYYGVSINGIETGTVSHDPGGQTMKMEKTENGSVVIKAGEKSYIIKAVMPSPQMIDAFKRDE